MKQSDIFLEKATNCAEMAEQTSHGPTHNRYKRMEAAWRALAAEQEWLDGEVAPEQVRNGKGKTPSLWDDVRFNPRGAG